MIVTNKPTTTLADEVERIATELEALAKANGKTWQDVHYMVFQRHQAHAARPSA